MRKLLTILFILIGFAGFAQPIVNRAGQANTVQDARLAAQYNFFLPRYSDTTSANTQKGIDTCGALIFTYDYNGFWYRQCSPKKWVQIFANSPSPSSDTLVWKMSGNTVGLRQATPVLGTLDNYDLNIMTSGTTTMVVPQGGIIRSSASPNKYLLIDTITRRLHYGDGGSGTLRIDTVEDYDALRKYEGDAVIIINVDSRTGGLFYKVSSGTENGATIIVDDLGGIWERQWDKVNYKPEFYQIFGKDINGQAYDRETGTGIGSEADAIINISLLAGDNGIIQYIPEKEYLIDRSITYQYNNQKHTGGNHKRAAPLTTLLVNNESIGATSIEVVDATLFQAGMNIVIKGAGTNGGFGDNSVGTGGNDYHLITGITGNTLTIQSGAKAINKAMLAGDTVVTVASFSIRVLDAAYTNEFIVLEDMEYDGNKAQNYQFLDYQVNCATNNLSGYITADNCTWRNSPGENMYLAGGRITNCFAYQLEGSFCHSSNDGQTLDSTYLEIIVENLVADSIGLGNSIYQGHSEASLFVGSTKSSNSIWKNCTVQNAGGSSGPAKMLWGLMTADDGIVQVYGGYYRKSRALINFNGLDSLTAKGRITIIEGAKFDNCGVVQMSGTNVRIGNGINGVYINKNTFINTRFVFGEIVNLSFTNNNVIMDSLTYIRWDNILASGTSQTAFPEQFSVLSVGAEADRVTISGNSFSGFDNDSISICIQAVLSNTIVTKVGSTSTLFYYGQNYDISRNTFNYFRYTLNTGLTQYTKATVGWTINNNIVLMGSANTYSSDYTWGLRIPPGAVADNNQVYNFWNTNYSWPLVAEGIFADGSGNETKLMGATLTNNKTFGLANHSIYISPFDNSPYNVVLKNNLRASGAISAGSIGLASSFRSGNDIMDATNLPYLTAPITPIGHRVLENKANY